MKSLLQHILTLLLLFIIISIFAVASGSFGPGVYGDHIVLDKYGTLPVIIMYVMRLLTLIPLPISLCNFLGIVLFNTFPEKPKLKTSTLFGPFICFRVVTRGTFPELVKKNVKRNLQLCEDLGLDNFVIEVATDVDIKIAHGQRVREVVVPTSYRSANGSLYKARALQYCLEDGVHMLSENDWIVHLDEETLLTESSLIGIINFINDDQYSFGQGVISYANEEVVNWMTTIADLARVGADYGILRFTLGYLHVPLFSWKGSFVVSKASAERNVTFDFGSEGSIAEDCFFALSAWRNGYKFGYIEGEMWEKSTFSIMDYIRQRKRWVQGIIMTLLSRQIPARQKFGISVIVLSWLTMPLTVPNLILVPLFPLPLPNLINFLCGFMGGTLLFLFIFGAIKSFNYRRVGLLKFALLCLLPIILMPVCIIMEASGVTLALFSKQQEGFHIVNKETASRSNVIEV